MRTGRARDKDLGINERSSGPCANELVMRVQPNCRGQAWIKDDIGIKAWCQELGLPSSGRKVELLEGLRAWDLPETSGQRQLSTRKAMLRC